MFFVRTPIKLANSRLFCNQTQDFLHTLWTSLIPYNHDYENQKEIMIILMKACPTQYFEENKSNAWLKLILLSRIWINLGETLEESVSNLTNLFLSARTSLIHFDWHTSLSKSKWNLQHFSIVFINKISHNQALSYASTFKNKHNHKQVIVIIKHYNMIVISRVYFPKRVCFIKIQDLI